MGFFAQQSKTILLDELNSFTITKPNYGDMQDLISKVVKSNMTTQQVEIDVAAQRKEEVCLWVTAWSGPDFEGRPCNRSNILALSSEIAIQMNKAIDAFGEPLTDTEKKE